MADFDRRRRQYVPVDVFVAFDNFGTALNDQWGMEGICAWILLLAASKREPVQGTFTFTTDDDAWGKLGAAATGFTIGEFLSFSGRWKKTSRTRSGRMNYVQISPELWDKWNTVTRQKSRKHPQNARALSGQNEGDTDAEVEGEVEGEEEATAGAHAPKRTPPTNGRATLERITRLVRNGVITDHTTLEAEMRAHPTLTDAERATLRALIAA